MSNRLSKVNRKERRNTQVCRLKQKEKINPPTGEENTNTEAPVSKPASDFNTTNIDLKGLNTLIIKFLASISKDETPNERTEKISKSITNLLLKSNYTPFIQDNWEVLPLTNLK